MASDAGAKYVSDIKASIAHGLRPTTMILGKNSLKPWGKWDILLAQAYQIFVDERCDRCGLPRWICHNDDSDILFDIDQDTCFASREIEETNDTNMKSTGYKPPSGTRMRPVPKLYSGGKFDGGMREGYYRAKYETELAMRTQVTQAA